MQPSSACHIDKRPYTWTWCSPPNSWWNCTTLVPTMEFSSKQFIIPQKLPQKIGPRTDTQTSSNFQGAWRTHARRNTRKFEFAKGVSWVWAEVQVTRTQKPRSSRLSNDLIVPSVRLLLRTLLIQSTPVLSEYLSVFLSFNFHNVHCLLRNLPHLRPFLRIHGCHRCLVLCQ